MGIYYSQHDVPSDEVLINRHNRLVLGEFKSRNYDIANLAVREPGLVTGVKRKLTRYLKAVYPLTPYQQPDEKPVEDTVVNTVDIITRNNKHPSFLWHTTAANISTSVKYGFGYASSLVGEVNKTLGQYHLDTFEDIDQGFVSHRYFVKKALLDLYQSRLEGLAQVESLINTQATPKQITAALDEYENKIDVLDAQLMSMRDGLGVNKISLDTFYTPVKNGFTQEIQRIKDFQEKVVNGFLQSSSVSVWFLLFVREQGFNTD